MKKFFSTLLLIAIVTCGASAQVRQSSGDFALMFDLTGLADLGLQSIGGGHAGSDSAGFSFSGGFGAKWFLADKLALRTILGFTNVSSSFQVGADSLNLENTVSNMSIVIAPAIQYNIASSSNVAGYIGGGVQFVTSSSKFDPADTNGIQSTTSNMSFGVGAMIGAEWFPWSNVSLGAEYTLSFSTTTGSVETVVGSLTTERDLPNATFIGIASRGRLMASIYFD